MKKLLMIAAVALMAVACNKNQKAVKKLDGTWNATSYTVSDGVTTVDILGDGLSYKMFFDGCKLKDDEFCNLTITVSDDGDTETSTAVYRVENDGARLELKENAAATTIESMEIIELTKSDLQLKQTIDGVTYELTLEKE